LRAWLPRICRRLRRVALRRGVQEQGEDVDAGDAVDHGVVRAVDDHDSAAPKSRDDGHLPQRPPHVEWPREDAHDKLAQRGTVARRGEHLAADVRAQVEIRIVDPHRVREVERHAVDLLAVSRHQVEAFFDRLLYTKRATAARDLRLAFEHVDGAEVERRLRPLGI